MKITTDRACISLLIFIASLVMIVLAIDAWVQIVHLDRKWNGVVDLLIAGNVFLAIAILMKVRKS